MAGLHGLGGGSAAKRARLDLDYSSLPNAHQNDRIEVIKLPPTITSNGAFNLSKSASKESNTSNQETTNDWTGLNLSSKQSSASSSSSSTQNADNDADAPLNLSLKSDTKSSSNDLSITTGSNSLQSLSSITAALGTGSGGDRICKFILNFLSFPS